MHISVLSRGDRNARASSDLQVLPVSKPTCPIKSTSLEAKELCNGECTAGKCRRSASSMYRGMLAWSAHVKKIAGYGAAASVGGATRTAAAGSGMGVFGFTSAGILKGSTAAKMMASAGGMLKAGSWCSFWQSASTASYSSLSAASVFGPCTLGMAAVGVFAYSKRREMYQGMTSVYTKILG
ncbi:TPA: hypothetical protein ACH3X3_003178 [Trebouxia sp. C0006]